MYVNYGLPPDYEALKRVGVLVKDKIVLARYGRSHRAVKTHTAEQAGARALILYSDPADDGSAKGPVSSGDRSRTPSPIDVVRPCSGTAIHATT